MNDTERIVIEGLKKTLKKKKEELNKAEEKYNDANRVAMEWEEKCHELRDQCSYEIDNTELGRQTIGWILINSWFHRSLFLTR